MYKHICKHCKEDLSFESVSQIGGHVKNCKLNPLREEGFRKRNEAGQIAVKIKHEKIKLQYEENPKKCIKCNKVIEYKFKDNNFCSHSCSASYNNNLRETPSDEIKNKIRLSLLKHYHGNEEAKNICRKNAVKNKLGKRKRVLIDFMCPVCNKTIQLIPSNAKTRKYCSGKCRNLINNQKLFSSRSKAETLLEEKLTTNFPSLNILFNNRETISGGRELDVYIPSLKLAIEWNGIWHYENCRDEKVLDRIQVSDSIKIKECKEKEIELIVIKDLTSNKKFIEQETQKIIEKIQLLTK